MKNCKACVHNDVCDVWRKEECQDANSVLTGGMDDCPLYVERGRARWIRRGNEMTCSKCKFIYYSNNDDFNFCPNCGAKMKGGDE